MDADVVIANMFVFGMTEVSVRQLNEICAKLEMAIRDLCIAADTKTIAYITESRPDMFYSPSSLERPDFEGIVRGWKNNPKAFIERQVKTWGLGPQANEKRLLDVMLKEIDDKPFEEIFGYVFTPEYAEKVFSWRIPKEHREKFKQIIAEYVASQIQEPVPAGVG